MDNANSFRQKASPKDRAAFLTDRILPVSPLVLYAESLLAKPSPPDIMLKYSEEVTKKTAPSKDAVKID